MGGEEALAIGLVDRVIEAENFLPEVLGFAAKLASGAGKALGCIKAAVNEGFDLPLEQALAVERKYVRENLKNHDAKEGLTAFGEKRKPDFQNR
jgi:enoyl-CoA hydratase